CDISIITAGQSHAVLLLSGSGMHGLQRGLRDQAGWMPSIWPIQGATGSTGLVPYSGPTDTDDDGEPDAYWWDPVEDEPGPKALAWKAALDAKPAGQPAPSAIVWVMGQNDAAKMGQDDTLSTAAYQSTHEALFEWMRDQIDT